MKEVNAFAADFEKKILTGVYTEGGSLTFEKYAAKYLAEYAELYQAPRTLQSTRAAINLFITDFGYMTLENLSPLFLQEYVNRLQNQKKLTDRSHTLSHGTIKRRMAVLSAMLSQAVRWNLITGNPMERVQIKKITPDTEKVMHFNQEQSEIFLRILDNPLLYTYSRRRADEPKNICSITEYQAEHTIQQQLKLFFYLAMFTGCRRGELIGQGVDIRTVSGILGHANTSTTLNIYAEYLKELNRSACDKLENILLRSAK